MDWFESAGFTMVPSSIDVVRVRVFQMEIYSAAALQTKLKVSQAAQGTLSRWLHTHPSLDALTTYR